MTRNSAISVVQLAVSGTLYLGVFITCALFIHFLLTENAARLQSWFMPCLGILLLPSVIVQLVSAVLLLGHRGDQMSATSSVVIAVFHILQVGFLWRHVDLFRECDPNMKMRASRQLNRLQLLFTVIAIIPVLLIQTFIIFHYEQLHWKTIAPVAVSLVSGFFYLASYRRTYAEKSSYLVQTCSVSQTMLRLTWRCGELASRSISLIVFASIYYFWIFLVVGLHGLAMMVCLCTPIFGFQDSKGKTRTSRTLISLMYTFIYTFVFVNYHKQNSVFRYSFYYLIMCLENGVLLTVWYLQSTQALQIFNKHAVLAVSCGAYLIGVTALVVLKTWFETREAIDSETEIICQQSECINCKLSICSKHNIKHQRPFSAGWMSQYNTATTNGNYYKNILQDSYFDSDVVSTAELLNSSGEHCHIRDTDVESVKKDEKENKVAVLASGTYTHKRFFDSKSSIARFNDADSITSGSGVYDEDWRQKPDGIMTQLSAIDALSLVSSRTHLLTDSWDSLMQQSGETQCDTKSPKKIDIMNSLIRKDLDTSFFSEGYSTDHTLESYQLPVTVLAKTRPNHPRKVGTAYSAASDSTDCTICAFMRQNESSPEPPANIPDPDFDPIVSVETRAERRRRRRREYNASRSSSAAVLQKQRRYSDQSDSEHSYKQKYEKASERQSRRQAIIISSTSKHARQFTESSSEDHHRKFLKSDLSSHKKQTPSSSYEYQVPLKLLRKCAKSETTDLSMLNQYDANCRMEVSSDSADSAYPRYTPVNERTEPIHHRHTPLDAYLAATDDDKDGTSESSCEMII